MVRVAYLKNHIVEPTPYQNVIVNFDYRVGVHKASRCEYLSDIICRASNTETGITGITGNEKKSLNRNKLMNHKHIKEKTSNK